MIPMGFKNIDHFFNADDTFAPIMMISGQIVAELTSDCAAVQSGYYTVVLLDGSGMPLGTTKIVIAK